MPDTPPNQPSSPPVLLVPEKPCPDELKASAREFFRKGAEVAYTLNYEYAVELYLDGLSFWPDALEEGHKPLREVALRRQAAGGKKSGFTDSSRFRKLSGKDPREALLKAEYLLSKDPTNLDHLADLVRAALDYECKATTFWMASLLFEFNRQRAKPSAQTYIFLRDVYARLEVYVRALQACQQALLLRPQDSALQDSLRDLAAQTTMQQGKYDSEGDFRDSIRDKDVQKKLHDQDRLVRSQKGDDDLLADARRAYQAEPDQPGKINRLVDLLVQTEQEDQEDEAVALLEQAYERTKQFRHKQRAGAIRIKQLNRQTRMLRELLNQQPDDEDLAQQVQELTAQLQAAELDHYRACVHNYPTDLGLKYELGRRLMAAKRYDDAIPCFQEARNDPRHRIAAVNGMGQCFFHKEWYPDAIETFLQALEAVGAAEDAVSKDLRYNLGRAYEAAGNTDEALKCFRKIAQIDFNYRDARARVDALRKNQENG